MTSGSLSDNSCKFLVFGVSVLTSKYSEVSLLCVLRRGLEYGDWYGVTYGLEYGLL